MGSRAAGAGGVESAVVSTNDLAWSGAGEALPPAAVDRNPLRLRPVLACRFASACPRQPRLRGVPPRRAVRSAASSRGCGLPAPIPGAS
jgi:hypothetical protein